MSHPALQTKPRKSGWSPARRSAQAEAIRRWKPWTRSTGPKSAAGKAVVAQNAAKISRLDRAALRMLKQAMADQSRYLPLLKRNLRALKFFPQNKLLKNERRRLLRQGWRITDQLRAALFFSQLCKNLDFPRPFRQIVNASSAAPMRCG